MTRFKAAVIQLNAGPVIEDNLLQADTLIRAAAKEGAKLIATPENTCRICAKTEDKLASAYEEKDHPALLFFASLAKELGIILIIGSISSIRSDDGKLENRSYIFSKDGLPVAHYDKIHMFDVNLPNGDRYCESDTHRAGDTLAIANVEGLKIGLSICYDIRFPHMYRALAQQGAEILSIPAAFTVPTGQAHWHVLLRARAIENGVYVLAAAQAGTHDGGRQTYGHSMIIDPWGEILVELHDDKPGFVLADIDLHKVMEARQAIPSLRHDKPFQIGN